MRFNQKKLKAIYENGRRELALILVMGIAGVWIITKGVIGISPEVLIYAMLGSVIGSIILGFCVLAFLISLYCIFAIRRV
mgnify:FL=1